MSAFGARLRELRVNAGRTLGDLAHAIGTSKPYLSEVERGTRGPLLPARLARAAAYLHANYAELQRLADTTRDPERGALLDMERAVRALVASCDSYGNFHDCGDCGGWSALRDAMERLDDVRNKASQGVTDEETTT